MLQWHKHMDVKHLVWQVHHQVQLPSTPCARPDLRWIVCALSAFQCSRSFMSKRKLSKLWCFVSNGVILHARSYWQQDVIVTVVRPPEIAGCQGPQPVSLLPVSLLTQPISNQTPSQFQIQNPFKIQANSNSKFKQIQIQTHTQSLHFKFKLTLKLILKCKFKLILILPCHCWFDAVSFRIEFFDCVLSPYDAQRSPFGVMPWKGCLCQRFLDASKPLGRCSQSWSLSMFGLQPSQVDECQWQEECQERQEAKFQTQAASSEASENRIKQKKFWKTFPNRLSSAFWRCDN